MGAWGIRNFENDTALDWISSFENSPFIEFVEVTVDILLKEDGFMDVDLIHETLASLEIFAAIKGNPSTDFPKFEIIDFDRLAKGLRTKIKPQLTNKCILALEKIKSGEDNELRELIEEGDKTIEWHKVIDDLRSRIE